MNMCDVTLSVSQCLIGLISMVFLRHWNAFSTLSFSKYARSVSWGGRCLVENISETASYFSASSIACLLIFPYLIYFFMSSEMGLLFFRSSVASIILLNRRSFWATLSFSLTQMVR